jgi:TPR repeat protein
MNIKEAEETLYDESGDYAKAFKIIEPMARQGDAKAQFLLSIIYRDGLGVRVNNAEALKWLCKAGEQDYFKAFLNLYFMYKAGEGAKKDNAEALKWLRKAGEQGDDIALMELIDMYRKGKSVKKDNAEALKWLRKAAENGYGFGLQELGLMYFEGNGVQQDYAEAAKLFRKASENNYGNVDDKLGLMYLEGLGVQKDYIEAAKCFNREAERGNDECLNKLFDMYKKGLIRESDDISMIKLFRKAEEGDSDSQLRLGMRKPTYTDYCNKLTLFVIGGLLTIALFAWYDWVTFAELLDKSKSKSWIWYCIGLSLIVGYLLNRKMSSIMYQIAPSARVSGIPFPVILYEPDSEGSDVWLDFTGIYTPISWTLNLFYYIIFSLAIAFSIKKYIFIIANDPFFWEKLW